jgi:transposase
MSQSKRYVIFKPYTMGQLQLPVDLEACIPTNHQVRVVHAAIERMDLSVLLGR